MAYFCTQCKRKHHSGKIYKEHKHLQKSKPNGVPCKKVLPCNWNLLPPIAQRQIMSNIRKMTWDKKSNGSRRREMYVHEINKVILRYDNDIPIIL